MNRKEVTMPKKTVTINPKKLSGEISIPPSKSMSHRAIIAASLSDGMSKITNVILSDDIIATINAMKNFGVEIEVQDNAGLRKTVIIKGNKNLVYTGNDIDCNESGSTLRFLIPFAGLMDEEVKFTGKGKLVERPLDVYYEIFDKQNISYRNEENKLPLVINGKLMAGEFELRGDISSQFITGLMFVLPLLDSDSKIIITTDLESKGYVDMTIDTLKAFGILIENKEYKEFYIKGNQAYKAREYKVEGDFSQAAFWIVAGAIGDKVICKDINLESLQADKKIIDVAKAMGADIKKLEDGHLEINSGHLKSMTIDASQIPDIIPVICVMASVSEGKTRIINASRLRIKESDRIKSTVSELSKLGADITELEDSIIINGKTQLTGAKLSSWNDHRIAMAMAIASIRCQFEVEISGAEAVSKSYPHFWEDFKTLGADINEYDTGN